MKSQLAIAVVLALTLTGCATTGFTSNAPVSDDQKAEARRSAFKSGAKGCGMGVGMTLLGSLFGGGVDARTAIAGCVVGGATTGIQEYNRQLNEFRALQGKVTVGAVVKVEEQQVEAEGKTTAAAKNLTLELDAAKVTARSQDIATVLSELAAVLNRQTMPIAVEVSGSPDDRAWLAGQLRAKVTNDKVVLAERAGSAPVIVATPSPVLR